MAEKFLLVWYEKSNVLFLAFCPVALRQNLFTIILIGFNFFLNFKIMLVCDDFNKIKSLLYKILKV